MASNKAFLGATVLVEDLDNGKKRKYTLVRPHESEVSQGKISVDSPVGKSLIGKGLGDLITVRVPGGVRDFEVLEVTYE
jgi:transcription elongation factor GreA